MFDQKLNLGNNKHMAKKSIDKRPSRQRQKERTKNNKIKQLEKHLELYPKDSNGRKKLERVKSGQVRAAHGIHPTTPEHSVSSRSKR